MEKNDIVINRIQSNFNRSVDSYEDHAVIQKIMAEKLFQRLSGINPDFSEVLEIGCGTGILSDLIMKNNPGYAIINDISPSMIQSTERLLCHYNSQKMFITGDFNHLKISNHFSLILSNAVLQWMPDLKKTLLKIRRLLKTQGLFGFSIFIPSTFTELEQSFDAAYRTLSLKSRKHTLPLLTEKEIQNALSKAGFRIRHSETARYDLFYPEVIDFLKSVKAIGASGFSKNRPGSGIIRSMMDFYKKNFYHEQEGIRVTYEILYCIAERNIQ